MRSLVLTLCLASSFVVVAHAGEPAAALSRDAITAHLRSLAVTLKLPKDVTGEFEQIFDSHVLVLHTGGQKVWVAPTKEKAACSTDALIAKEKEEKGFRSVTKRGTDPKLPLVASLMTGDDGKDRFLVEGCTPKANVLCGSDEPKDAAGMKIVWDLCSTLRDK